MSAAPIRCTAPHPDDPRRRCNAVVCEAVPGTVEIQPSEDNPPPGCTRYQCRRCGTRYVVCARAA